jgi:hypothetical protein
VEFYGRTGGMVPSPDEVLAALEKMAAQIEKRLPLHRTRVRQNFKSSSKAEKA